MTAASVAAARTHRDQRRVLGAAAIVSAAAWLALVAGQPHANGALVSLVAAFLMWTVMMVAMMLPPVVPWILFFTAARVERAGRTGPVLPAGVFLAGYLTVWTGFALVAALLQVGLVEGGLMAGFDLRLEGWLGGAVLMAAGGFQFSSLKAACLTHCRTPLGFFLARWRDGPAGAFGMGFEHGRYCVGCCWMLMVVSFALGVMNLAWMAVLTLGLSIEKIAPRGPTVGRAFGAMLLVWGGWTLAAG
jgi:predicted metal-binding membrane protein